MKIKNKSKRLIVLNFKENGKGFKSLPVPAGAEVESEHLTDKDISFYVKKGSIEVTIKKTEDNILCSVTDTGIGITKKEQEKVFDKFQQFGRKNGPGYRGTGLGLSITKALIELHGGTITIKSKYNKGTTFSFLLPERTSKQSINPRLGKRKQ